MWECVGGSALKGEDSLSAALRETEEEVGIKLSPEKGKIPYSRIRRVVHGVRFSYIVDVWLFEYDGPVNLELATTKEVTQALWMNKSKIKELFDEGKLINTLGYFLNWKKYNLLSVCDDADKGTGLNDETTVECVVLIQRI